MDEEISIEGVDDFIDGKLTLPVSMKVKRDAEGEPREMPVKPADDSREAIWRWATWSDGTNLNRGTVRNRLQSLLEMPDVGKRMKRNAMLLLRANFAKSADFYHAGAARVTDDEVLAFRNSMDQGGSP